MKRETLMRIGGSAGYEFMAMLLWVGAIILQWMLLKATFTELAVKAITTHSFGNWLAFAIVAFMNLMVLSQVKNLAYIGLDAAIDSFNKVANRSR